MARRKTVRLAAAEAELKALQEKQAQDMREREASTAARAMAKNPQVYKDAGITSGGFASQNTGTNENFSFFPLHQTKFLYLPFCVLP